jgi:hypothetical protein
MKAVLWYNSLNFQEKYNQIIKLKNKIVGYPTRNPESLTQKEIEIVFNNNKKQYYEQFKNNEICNT